MKEIEIKTVELEIEAGTEIKRVPFNYKDNLLNALNIAPVDSRGQPVGFTPESMEQRLRIRDKVRKAEDKLLLDDDDYKALKSCVEQQRFVIMHESILEYYNAIKNAKSI